MYKLIENRNLNFKNIGVTVNVNVSILILVKLHLKYRSFPKGVFMNRQLIDCISVMLETTLNVDSQVINLKGFDISEIDMDLRSKIAGTRSPLEVTLSSTMTENLKKQEDQKRIFCFTDSFGVDYASILFREDETDRIFQIGPVFLNDLKNPDFVPDILSKNKLTSDFTVPLTEYYYHLPFVNQPTYIAVINGIAGILFGGNDYDVVFIDENISVHDVLYEPKPNSADDLASSVLEERYNIENQMLNAVSRGDRREAMRYHSEFRKNKMRPRSADHVRDQRNYMIIMNTLCRKAAQEGGVHPMQLNSISRDFALQIEEASGTEELNEISLNIIRVYTSAVSHHSYASYSPMISNAMNYIANHLDLPLSLKDVADSLNVNPSYLSTQFKKETGVTVTDYIRAQKIEYASILLTTTSRQVQEVAEAVGFYDVQYFSKLFKKEKGSTPSTYRQLEAGFESQLRDSRKRVKN